MKKYIQYSPLDVNLEVDRSSNIVADLTVVLKYPPIIRFGEEVVFTIENYNTLVQYAVSCERGNVRIEDDLIYYTAPDSLGNGHDQLYVDIGVNPIQLAYFKSSNGDYFYNADGLVSFTDEVLTDDSPDSQTYKDFIKEVQESHDDLLALAKKNTPVARIQHYDYSANKPMKSESFDIGSVFGQWSSEQRSWQDDGVPSGGVEGYHLPSNINLKTSPLRSINGLIEKDGKFIATFKSRNSNTDEAAGNVNTGYRYPGAIGSSLTVIKTGDTNNRRFVFDIPLDLYALVAIVPEEILSLCITSLEIRPILQGIPDGHTFLWEQISGDETDVEWLSNPTDVDLVVNLGKKKTDRVFRFWISKGTKYERYYDVIVYGTPRDEIAGSPSANNNFEITGTNIGTARHETRPILLTAERLWLKEFKVQFIDKIR